MVFGLPASSFLGRWTRPGASFTRPKRGWPIFPNGKYLAKKSQVKKLLGESGSQDLETLKKLGSTDSPRTILQVSAPAWHLSRHPVPWSLEAKRCVRIVELILYAFRHLPKIVPETWGNAGKKKKTALIHLEHDQP